jgi:hypothetical protein
MTKDKRGKGVLIHGEVISGYLIIGKKHFEIYGQRVSDIQTHFHVVDADLTQGDLFDEQSSLSGERKRDLV